MTQPLTIKWDGNQIPKIILDCIKNHNLFLYGGSLIHDFFFKDEKWGYNRDYDLRGSYDNIWNAINDIRKIAKFNIISFNKSSDGIHSDGIHSDGSASDGTESDDSESDYEATESRIERNNMIRKYNCLSITNVKITSIKNTSNEFIRCKKNLIIQFIENIKEHDIKKIVIDSDLSFNKCYYDGKNIYFFTNPNDIKNKIGYLNINNFIIRNGVGSGVGSGITDFKLYTSSNQTYTYQYKITKQIMRIKKYIKRGFIINNICHSRMCCYRSQSYILNPSIKHYYEHFLNNTIDDYDLIMENEYKEYINCSNNFHIAVLAIMIKRKKFEKFKQIFDMITSMNIVKPIHITGNYHLVFKIACDIGAFSIAKFIYEYYNKNNLYINFEYNNHIIFKNTVKYNHIKTVQFLCDINKIYDFDYIDDCIISYRINNVYDVLQKTKSLTTLFIKNSKHFNSIQIPEKEKEKDAVVDGDGGSGVNVDVAIIVKKIVDEIVDKDELCSICNNEKLQITLPCNHNTCYNCIIRWCKEKHTNRKANCPFCREYFHLNFTLQTYK